MTEGVLTVAHNDKLAKALEIIRQNNIRHLPVMNGNAVIGMISRTDLNRLTFGALFENQDGADESVLEMLSITQVMTSKPRTVRSDESIKDVAEIFANEEFHALPVVDDHELKGIVTTTDVIQYLLDQY
jgi:CBS domain-containing protein